MCPVLVPSELFLSTHLPTPEGWTAELAVGLYLVLPLMGFKPACGDLTRLKTLLLSQLTMHCLLAVQSFCDDLLILSFPNRLDLL